MRIANQSSRCCTDCIINLTNTFFLLFLDNEIGNMYQANTKFNQMKKDKKWKIRREEKKKRDNE